MKGGGYKKLVSFVDSRGYGKSMNKYFTQFTLENGNEILGTFPVPPDQHALSAELTKIKELNPEVVYFGGLTPLPARLPTPFTQFPINAQPQGTPGLTLIQSSHTALPHPTLCTDT